MAHFSSPKLNCCQLPGYLPFRHQLTTQEVSALVRHHWPVAESVSSCSGKMRELNLLEFQPAEKTNSERASPPTSRVLLASIFRWSLNILVRKGKKTPWFFLFLFFFAIPQLKRITDQDAGRSPGWPSLHFLPKEEWAPETIQQNEEEVRAALLQISQGWASFLHWDKSWCIWPGHCFIRKDINAWNFTMDSELKGKRAKKKKIPYRQQALEI